MKKMFINFAQKFRNSQCPKPCGVKTIQRPENVSFIDWRIYIEEEAVATELKNSKIKYELGFQERFQRRLTRMIVESNFVN